MLTVTLIVALPNPNRTCQSVHGVWCENWTAVQTHYLHAVSSERRRAVWQEKIIGNNFDRLWMDISMAGGRATNACIVLCFIIPLCVYTCRPRSCVDVWWFTWCDRFLSVQQHRCRVCHRGRARGWLHIQTQACQTEEGTITVTVCFCVGCISFA